MYHFEDTFFFVSSWSKGTTFSAMFVLIKRKTLSLWRICKRNAYELDNFNGYGAELPTFDGSINKQQTLACCPSV
jgi:hypothetical protein